MEYVLARSAPRSVGGAAASPRPWYAQLWVHVFIAMVVGIALGIAAPNLGARMQPLADAFIKIIRALIAPIIFCTVVHGIARMADMARVGRVTLKAIVYFEALTTVALILGLVAVNLWRPGAGMNINLAHVDTSAAQTYVQHPQTQTAVQFITNIIPTSFIGAFTDGNVLQVLLIAVLCGFALTRIGARGRAVTEFIGSANEMIFAVVGLVMWTAPLGAFGAIAFTVGKFGAGSLVSLGKLLAGFYAVCLVFVFGVLWAVARWCGFSVVRLVRYLREEILIAIATTSSETVLPQLMGKLENLGCEESVVGLVIPTGYSFNLDGTCLYLATAAVFLAHATNTSLSIGQQLGLLVVILRPDGAGVRVRPRKVGRRISTSRPATTSTWKVKGLRFFVCVAARLERRDAKNADGRPSAQNDTTAAGPPVAQVARQDAGEKLRSSRARDLRLVLFCN